MCEAIKLDSSQGAIAKLNWFLSKGYTVVDRFELPDGFILIVEPAEKA